jgi:hypothetical protein
MGENLLHKEVSCKLQERERNLDSELDIKVFNMARIKQSTVETFKHRNTE